MTPKQKCDQQVCILNSHSKTAISKQSVQTLRSKVLFSLSLKHYPLLLPTNNVDCSISKIVQAKAPTCHYIWGARMESLLDAFKMEQAIKYGKQVSFCKSLNYTSCPL